MVPFIVDTLDVVIIGVVAVAKGESLTKPYSNKLICLKVLLQVISIVFFVIIVLFTRN